MGMFLDPVPGNTEQSVTDVIWRWFKKVWSWAKGEANVAPVTNVTIGTSTTLTGDFFYPVDATVALMPITLPLAVNNPGKKYVVKKTDSGTNTVVISASGADTVDGALGKILYKQYETMVFVSDGTATWHVMTGDMSNIVPTNSLDKQVIFNDTNSLVGNSKFTYDKTLNQLNIVATPVAWDNGNSDSELQVGVSFLASSVTNIDSFYTTNLYYNAGWKYAKAVKAGTLQWQTNDGTITWWTAPLNGGAAGAAATLTQRMTLSNLGKLGVGQATPVSRVHLTANGATTTGVGVECAGVADNVLLYSGTVVDGANGWKLMQDELTTGDQYLKARNSSADTLCMYYKRSNAAVGVGTAPLSQFHVYGAAGVGAPVKGGGTLLMDGTLGAVGDGGAILFGAGGTGLNWAGIKGNITNSGNNSIGYLDFYTRRVSTDANLTLTLRLYENGRAEFYAPVRPMVYTFAGLPAGVQGDRAFVTDSTTAVFAAVAAGGGANPVPVYYDGGNWKVG